MDENKTNRPLKLKPTPTKVKESEDQVQEAIFRFLSFHNIFCWRNNTTGVFDPTKKIFRRPSKWHRNGVPDILGILSDGRFLGIEVKATGKSETESQIQFHGDAHQASSGEALIFTADSLDKVRNNERLQKYLRKGQE